MNLSYIQEVLRDLSGNTNVLYVLNFGVQPKVQPVPAALRPYLLATANCQSNNPTIIALAKSITTGSTSQYTSATKIYNWVRDNINYAFYYNTQKGALGTLSSRSANCADTSHLMVALERAAGIPARYEHIYAQFSSGNWYGHVIAQVYVDGKWYYADGTKQKLIWSCQKLEHRHLQIRRDICITSILGGKIL